MNKSILFLFLLGLLLGMNACNNKGSSPEEKKTAYNDFLAKFPSFPLPYQFNEDSLSQEYPDSLRLEKPESHQFIPDSIWLGSKKGKTVKIFPVGRNNYGELHLVLLKSVTDHLTQVELLIFGKADSLVSSKTIASMNDQNPGHDFSFRLDDNYLLSVQERKEEDNGHVVNRENVYGIDPQGILNLILTNNNEPVSPGTFYNPIDTLPEKNKYSGDYTSGKFNLVSIRDGKEDKTFQFFIHLNKHNGDCRGELDGVAKFVSKEDAEFKDEDGICAIRFIFSTDKVVIKEVGGCGAFRGISCFFDGSYREEKIKN